MRWDQCLSCLKTLLNEGKCDLKFSLGLKGEPWERIHTHAQIVNHSRGWKVVTALCQSQGMFLWLFLSEACWLLMLLFGQWFGSLGDASHASICKYYHQSRRVTSYLQSLDAEAPKHQVVKLRYQIIVKFVSCIVPYVPCWAHKAASRKGERHDVLAGFLCWNRVVESRHQR